jgi:hypothetical protein
VELDCQKTASQPKLTTVLSAGLLMSQSSFDSNNLCISTPCALSLCSGAIFTRASIDIRADSTAKLARNVQSQVDVALM